MRYSSCLIYNLADLVFAPIMRIFGIRVIYSERIDGDVIAGNMDDKSYYRKMRSFINRNHLQERVIFLGHVGDMSKEYEAADLGVLPSCSEGTPNVVLEAYAYGRPIIVLDIEMEREVVQDPDLRLGLKNTDGINKCIKYI